MKKPKRGRPLTEQVKKSKYLGTRVGPEMREALTKAAAENRRNISREIEERLRASFDYDRKILDQFGDRQTYALLRLVSILMKDSASIRGGWLDDPWAFDQVIDGVTTILKSFRPPDDSPSVDNKTDDLLLLMRQFGGKLRAEQLVAEVLAAPPILPAGAILKKRRVLGRERRTKDKDPIPFIRSDLGPLVLRLEAGQARQSAQEDIIRAIRADFVQMLPPNARKEWAQAIRHGFDVEKNQSGFAIRPPARKKAARKPNKGTSERKRS